MLVSALQVPGGNPVDGLQPAPHTKTIAEPATVGPLTQVHMTLKISFRICFPGESAC